MWASDYVELDEVERWLVEPLIPPEGVVNFYGKPKAAKSFAAIGIALAVSSGAKHWNGFKIHVNGPVLYFQVDTPRMEWLRRFRNAKAAGYELAQVAIVDRKMSPYPFNILDPKHATWFKQQVDAVKPVLIVIDTLRESNDADENDSLAMKQVVNKLVSIAGEAALILVSHSRKDSAWNAMGAESDIMDEGRGSSYISGRMDTVVKFTGGKNGKGHMFFKGRSVDQTKVPIYQDGPTGLVLLEGDHVMKETATTAMLRDHAHEWSKNKMAKELVAQGAFENVRTATRWIEKLSSLAEHQDTPSSKPDTGQ